MIKIMPSMTNTVQKIRNNSLRGRLIRLNVGESLEIPRTESAEVTVRTTCSNLKPYNGQTYTVTRTAEGVRATRTS